MKKVVKVTPLDDGLSEVVAGAMFDKIEAFAGYGFNRAHSVEYTIISYWSMWLKINYPHEFYGAFLEIMKEERLQAIVRDASKQGIEVLPPDINISTGVFERDGDHLIAPFHRLKHFSDKTLTAILEAREKAGGHFNDTDHFLDNVEKRRCNVKHRGILEAVGAFASITPGTKPPDDPERLKDQIEYLPGLILPTKVRADRKLHSDKEAKAQLLDIIQRCRDEQGGVQPLPRLGRSPKFAVVFDCPTGWEESAGKMMEGDGGKYVRIALKDAGFTISDGYFTMLSKVPKDDKQVSNNDVNRFKPYLEEELAALNPPVIVLLGSVATRTLAPEMKGGIMDIAGSVHFDKERDANMVVGINPMMLYHDPKKQDTLNAVFRQVKELL